MDPAVLNVPYTPIIDIRKHVDYKATMSQYNLGPNGTIMTCLNLFALKFTDLYNDTRLDRSITVVDTPGQIEVFTWSASGTIIARTISSNQPTIIAYIIDASRCFNPSTFMSNMLYACSVYYRFNLPFVIVFNKMDLDHDLPIFEWLRDFSLFQEALQNQENYMTDLVQSMALVLEEFYSKFSFCKVSSTTGAGMDDAFKLFKEALKSYDSEKGLDKFIKDLKIDDTY